MSREVQVKPRKSWTLYTCSGFKQSISRRCYGIVRIHYNNAVETVSDAYNDLVLVAATFLVGFTDVS